MERNIDKIKRLEHELGRYRKKVMDQGTTIQEQHKALMQADNGNRETQMLVDAVLTAATLACGTAARDQDTGEDIGWRLALPMFDIKEIREKYEIRARRDEQAQTYVLGVVPRRTDDPA